MFNPSKGSLDLFFHLFFLSRYSRRLEEETFAGKTGDFLFMIMLGSTLMLFAAPIVQSHFLGNSLTFMLVYVWSKRNPWTQLQFLGLMNFTAPWLPWVCYPWSVTSLWHGLYILTMTHSVTLVFQATFIVKSLHSNVYWRWCLSIGFIGAESVVGPRCQRGSAWNCSGSLLLFCKVDLPRNHASEWSASHSDSAMAAVSVYGARWIWYCWNGRWQSKWQWTGRCHVSSLQIAREE